MAPLMVEGNTLAEKHRSYNKIMNEACKNNTFQQITEINYEESDLENLFKIDIASHNRNVEYILTVLKGQDMLYISRAIKQATWLITDPQNAPIINPNYLYNDLFPQMTSKAINKFILHIRLNLKDEQRVEEFFNYYKEKDLKTGFKWLPHCSNTFIENIVSKHANDIPSQLLKRLCEKSILFLDIFLKNYSHYYKYDVLKSTLFLLNYNAESYIDIVERNNVIESLPALGPKFTKILMNKCGDKVKQNLDKFCQFIHIPTFAKYIKKEEVKEIILKNLRNRRMSNWFSHINVKHFVYRLPAEERFELIKEIFIEKKYQDDANLGDDIVPLHTSYRCASKVSSENIYCWYIYAPFNIAFTDLKKIIRSESNPSDRMGMFGVMLACARNNMQDIQTLLKYYRENHINEPYKFKSQFVNLVVTRTHTHRYNKTTWGYLNDLFVSMDVYTESDKNVQSCLKSIVLYNVINDQSVPEVVEKNFTFDTFKKYHIKFTQDEKDKVFSYLFRYINLKLNKYDKTKKEDLTEAVEVLKNILQLIEDCGKALHDFPTVVDEIKDIVNIQRTNKSWDCDLTKLYNIPKPWKKLLFEESIVLNPNQEACINALKHGPQVLETCKEEVEVICASDNILAERFLKKIRIYWSQSLANDFKNLFIKKLNQNNNHKAVITGLCTLLPQQEFISLVQKYMTKEGKIDWNQHDEVEFSACKHIASSLHVARPQPSLDIALSFVKSDYLQYILPSLSALLYNISYENGRKYLKRLRDAPVSLQKHGIRFSLQEGTENRKEVLTEKFAFRSKKEDKNGNEVSYQMAKKYSDIFASKDSLKIFYANAKSIVKKGKINELICVLQSFQYQIHVVIITETWIKSEDQAKQLSLLGFKHYYNNRNTTKGGGVSVFIHDSLKHSVTKNIRIEDNHYLWIYIDEYSLDIGAVYKNNRKNVVEFLETYSSQLSNKKKVIVIGDFNFDPLNPDSPSKKYINALDKYKLSILNKIDPEYSTRVTPTKKSILDHVCTNLQGHSFHLALIDSALSDHNQIYIELKNYKPDNKILNPTGNDWINKIILDGINKRNTLWQDYKNNPKDNLEKELKVECKKVMDCLISIKSVPLEMRNLINSLHNKKIREHYAPSEIITPNNIIKDQKQIFNYYNEFFRNIDKILFENNLPQFYNNNINALPNKLINNYSLCAFTPTTTEEIGKIVNSLTRLDKISAKERTCVEGFLTSLAECINQCLQTGSFPKSLMIGNASPVFKSTSKTNPRNYLSTSVSPVTLLSKVFEKIIYNRLESYLETSNFFNNRNYGFRQKSNTLSATIDLVTEIKIKIDKKQIALGIFIDFTKAFDSVSHDLLLEKLDSIGIAGNALRIFKSYFENRCELVPISEHQSEHDMVNWTAQQQQQQSLLESLLFLIFINNIQDALSGDIAFYGQYNTRLVYFGECIDTVMERAQDDLYKLNEWFQRNYLPINPNQARYIVFAAKHKKISSQKSLTLNNEIIKKSKSTNYLGLILDSSLTFEPYLNKLCGELRSIMKFFKCFGQFMSKHVKYSIFNCLIKPYYIDYLIEVWGTATKPNKEKVQIAQKNLLDVMFQDDLINKQTKIMSVSQTYAYKTCVLIRKLLNREIHSNIEFSKKSRKINNIHLYAPRTNYGKNSLMYEGASMYNKLPEVIKEAKTMNVFKKLLKIHITESHKPT